MNLEDSGISAELKRFILNNIDSIELLEVLLLLRKDSKRSWTAAEVSSELRTDPKSAQRRLNYLSMKNLAVVEGSVGSFRYQPITEELSKMVFQLDSAYRERKFSVINLIFSKPIDRIHVFADAFDFRKEKQDG